MRYGGRHSDYFCTNREKWRHEHTKYYYWNGFSWRLEDETGSDGWLSTVNPRPDYYTFFQEVTSEWGALEWGAKVHDVPKHKGTNWCFDSDWEFAGVPNVHFLE